MTYRKSEKIMVSHVSQATMTYRPPSPFRGRGEVMEAAGGGKRKAIEKTKHSRRAFGMIVAPRAWSSSSGLLDVCPEAAASQDPARFPGCAGEDRQRADAGLGLGPTSPA